MSDDEKELSDLIKKGVKYKLFLLVFFLLVLIVGRSTIAAAPSKIAALQKDHDGKLAAFLESSGLGKVASTIPKDPEGKWAFDQTSKRILQAFLPLIAQVNQEGLPSPATPRGHFGGPSGTQGPNDPNAEQMRKAELTFREWLALIEEFEESKRQVYVVGLEIPHVKGPISVNTLDVLNLWPFAIVFLVAVIFGLSMKQRMRLILLAYVIDSKKNDDGRISPRLLSGVSPGTLSSIQSQSKPVRLYRTSWAELLEFLLTAGLLIAVLWLSGTIFMLSDPAQYHRTDSILLSYYSLLFSAAVLAMFVLRKTHSYYWGLLDQSLGAPVVDEWLFWFRRKCAQYWNTAEDRSNVRARRLGTMFLAAVGLVAMFLPFATDLKTSIRGYQFFSAPGALSASGNLFEIDPQISGEIGIHVGFGLVFLLLCFGNALSSTSANGLAYWMSTELRHYMSFVVLLLTGNLVLYVGAVHYQLSVDTLQTVLDAFAPAGGFLEPHGIPLAFFQLRYGLLLFGASCTLLALWEDKRERKRLARHFGS